MALNKLLCVFVAVTLAIISFTPPPAAETKKDEREGGIIGTGIVGTITELGSIIVNNQRITFGDDMMASSVLGEITASSLVPGQLVSVMAERSSDIWNAKTIEVHYPLIGPLKLENGRTWILGTSVDLSQTDTAGISEGDWLAVSGLWQQDRLIASAVSKLEQRSLAVLSGTYMPSADTDSFLIGQSIVSGVDLAHVEPGDVVTVTGRPSNDGIVAETVRIGLFSGSLEKMIVEGYMSAPMTDGLYTILGSGAVTFTDRPEMIDTSLKGMYCIQMPESPQSSNFAPLAPNDSCSEN